jgi:hypothetical protein
MKTPFNLPQYRTVFYRMNPETGYFTKTEKQPEKEPFMRLPYELRVTPAQAENIRCNVNTLILSREKTKKGKYKFITGLLDTDFKNWFSGNDYVARKDRKIISIVLFQFSEDNSRLLVYYFPGYDKGNTKERIAFSNMAIPAIQRQQPPTA